MKQDYPEFKYNSKELESFANAADNKIKEAFWGGISIGFTVSLTASIIAAILFT